METFNPDGTPYNDEWHCSLVGDQVVVYEHGQEMSDIRAGCNRYLLQQHREEYEQTLCRTR